MLKIAGTKPPDAKLSAKPDDSTHLFNIIFQKYALLNSIYCLCVGKKNEPIKSCKKCLGQNLHLN